MKTNHYRGYWLSWLINTRLHHENNIKIKLLFENLNFLDFLWNQFKNVCLQQCIYLVYLQTFSRLDTVQDYLIKLGIKSCVHILEISIFSLNHVIVRPTKIMHEQPPQRLQNSYFQSHFSASKINEIFLIFFCEEY